MTEIQKANNGCALSSKAQEDHREWIGGRILTLLGHYWREDDPVELTGAIARDWAEILQGLPADVIQGAVMRYLRDEPRRKPTPGAIYAIALDMVPRPKIVPRSPSLGKSAPPKERVSADRAAEIMAEAGYRSYVPKKFPITGDGNAD